jgi:hypothetical protein
MNKWAAAISFFLKKGLLSRIWHFYGGYLLEPVHCPDPRCAGNMVGGFSSETEIPNAPKPAPTRAGFGNLRGLRRREGASSCMTNIKIEPDSEQLVRMSGPYMARALGLRVDTNQTNCPGLDEAPSSGKEQFQSLAERSMDVPSRFFEGLLFALPVSLLLYAGIFVSVHHLVSFFHHAVIAAIT